MSRKFSDLSLDEIVTLLIAGETITVEGGEDVVLKSEESRSILAFYNANRSPFWELPKKNVFDPEIDKILAALNTKPVPPAIATPTVLTRKRWKLIGIKAHRFAGLHRHCADLGADPELLDQAIDGELALLRGFNGAGKTSLLNAICWCLTGKGYRPQALPTELHATMAVDVMEEQDVPGSQPIKTKKSDFKLPVLVPVPSDHELALVGGQPKIDTWVSLKFRSLDDGKEVEVTRTLKADKKNTYSTSTKGIEALGLGDLALQVGTLMPGVAAAMRLSEKTTLSDAIAILTGLRPLAIFGDRAVTLHDRLTNKYTKAAGEAKDSAFIRATKGIAILKDLVRGYKAIPNLDCIVHPKEDDRKAWKPGIAEARTILIDVETSSRTDAQLILPTFPLLNNEQQVNGFVQGLERFEHLMSKQGIRSLESIQIMGRLAKISKEDVAATEQLIDEIHKGAKKLIDWIRDAKKFQRLQLYALVSKWHEHAHPGTEIENCPVCDRGLTGEGAPFDKVLDESVAQALEKSRSADAAMMMSAEEWEKEQVRVLLEKLPDSLRQFAHEDHPEDLFDIYKTALTDEIFNQAEVLQSLKQMAAGAKKNWDELVKAAPAPLAKDARILPGEVPDKANLREVIERVGNAVRLAQYRELHGESAKAAISALLWDVAEGDARPANERSLAVQIGTLKTYAQLAQVLVSLRNQISDIEQACFSWQSALERIDELARAAEAIKPFMKFQELVQTQIARLISTLNEKSKIWAESIYVPPLPGSPTYAGLDADSDKPFRLLASKGLHQFEASEIMNASALRSYLWAFVLALWEHIWEKNGGTTTMLMDDPQDLLDSTNINNLAASVPKMLTAEMNPIIASNDIDFLEESERYVRKVKGAGTAIQSMEFSAVSNSRSVVLLTPLMDEIVKQATLFEGDETNGTLAVDFVKPVRIRIEARIWDILGSDNVVLKNPGLGDLLNKVQKLRTGLEEPFTTEPFRKLLEHPSLKPGAKFRETINDAHHSGISSITPQAAKLVLNEYKDVFSVIDNCWNTYARMMRRLPPEKPTQPMSGAPNAPNVVPFPKVKLPMLGKLAAHDSSTYSMDFATTAGEIDLTQFGAVSLYTIKENTLGLMALVGQTAVISLTSPVGNGDLAIVQTTAKTYARRVGIDPNDNLQVALEAIQTASKNPKPTAFVLKAEARMSRIIGVLFDYGGQGKDGNEAIPTQSSPILSNVIGMAEVDGDSAFPIAKDGDYVLLGNADKMEKMVGRIVAVVTASDDMSTMRSAYLKRLGKPMPGNPNVHYLENVGEIGEGEYVQVAELGVTPLPGIQVIDKIWRVHGIMYAP